MKKSVDLVLLLIVLTDGKSNKSSLYSGRQTDEEDPRNHVSLKFGRQVIEERQPERKSPPGDNPRESGIPGSNQIYYYPV